MNRRAFAFLLALVNAIPMFGVSSDSLQTNRCANRWQIQFTSGYGFSATPSLLGQTYINDGQNNITGTMIHGTLGEGIVSTLTAHFRIKNKIHISSGYFANYGIEKLTLHGGNILNPAQYEDDWKQVFSQGILIGSGVSDTCGRFTFSASASFVCGLYNVGSHRTFDAWSGNSYYYEWEHTGGLSFGWMGTVVASYQIDDHFSMGLQGFFISHSWSPNKGYITEYKYNNEDRTSTLSEASRTVEYVDDMVYSSISGYPNGQRFSFSLPLSNAGASLVLNYNF